MRFLLVALVALALFLPFGVQAADSCTCFCGTTSKGAYELTGKNTRDACIQGCQDANESMIGCYESTDEYPENSEICWTQNECEGSGRKALGYEWNTNVSVCPNSPLDMGYCFAPQKEVNLIVPFGGNTKFSSFPDYVDAAYQFLIPVAGLVAVVMFMVSGLQYVLARGATDVVKKAKTRMVGAVTGLVLLMAAYAVANVLDPRLVHLKQLRIPITKEVILLDPDSTCEYLASVGYEVDGKKGSEVKGDCKTQGSITSIDNVASNVVSGTWEVGNNCNYSTCSEGTSCTSQGCYSCRAADVVPSEQTCNELTATESAPGTKTGTKYYCEYDDDVGDGGSCVSVSSGVSGTDLVGINCTVLRSGDGGGSCGSYDALYYHVGAVNQSRIDNVGAQDESFVDVAQSTLATICSTDPCGLAGDGHKCSLKMPSESGGGTVINETYYRSNYVNCVRDDQELVTKSQGSVFWTEPTGMCKTRRPAAQQNACSFQ